MMSSHIREMRSRHLQKHLHKLSRRPSKWSATVKSKHATLALSGPGRSNQFRKKPKAGHLGTHLDRRLTWITYIKTKRNQDNASLEGFSCSLVDASLSIAAEERVVNHNKRLRTCDIHPSGSAANSYVEFAERFRKTVRLVCWFVPNTL